MPLGGASRFAVLNIDDDSDEDSLSKVVMGKGANFKSAASKNKKRRRPNKKAGAKVNEEGFMVCGEEPVISMHRPGADTGETDADIQEAVFRAQLEYAEMLERQKLNDARLSKAMEESKAASAQQHDQRPVSPSKAAAAAAPVKSNSTAASQKAKPKQRATKTPSSDDDSAAIALSVGEVMQQVDEQAKELIKDRASKLQPSEQKLVNLYRSKLRKVVEDMTALQSEFNSTQQECTKYKDRYKKLCELLKDAEVKEKAKLIMEVEKSAAQREELTEELQELHGTVEQQRSKIHELEHSVEHLKKSHAAEK